MNDNSTKNPTVIFYRTSNNAEQSLAYQQPLLEKFKNHPDSKVIDYRSDDNFMSMDLFPVIREQGSRFIVITQSPITKKDFDYEFEHYKFFDIYQELGRVELYYMNPYGKLYKSVENIEDILKTP
jgi:hypothetical protein